MEATKLNELMEYIHELTHTPMWYANHVDSNCWQFNYCWCIWCLPVLNPAFQNWRHVRVRDSATNNKTSECKRSKTETCRYSMVKVSTYTVQIIRKVLPTISEKFHWRKSITMNGSMWDRRVFVCKRWRKRKRIMGNPKQKSNNNA